MICRFRQVPAPSTPSPSQGPSSSPSAMPSISPIKSPSQSPSTSPSRSPSAMPSISPSRSPSQSPTNTMASPSQSPSKAPSTSPSQSSPTGSVSRYYRFRTMSLFIQSSYIFSPFFSRFAPELKLNLAVARAILPTTTSVVVTAALTSTP